MASNINKQQYSLKDKIKMYAAYIGQLQDELCACSEIKWLRKCCLNILFYFLPGPVNSIEF